MKTNLIHVVKYCYLPIIGMFFIACEYELEGVYEREVSENIRSLNLGSSSNTVKPKWNGYRVSVSVYLNLIDENNGSDKPQFAAIY